MTKVEGLLLILSDLQNFENLSELEAHDMKLAPLASSLGLEAKVSFIFPMG